MVLLAGMRDFLLGFFQISHIVQTAMLTNTEIWWPEVRDDEEVKAKKGTTCINSARKFKTRLPITLECNLENATKAGMKL